MYDVINETFLEFALTVQSAIKRGWELGEIEYGERRLGVSSRLTIRRGDQTENIWSPDDLASLIEKEVREEEDRKWKEKYESLRSNLSSPPS